MRIIYIMLNKIPWCAYGMSQDSGGSPYLMLNLALTIPSASSASIAA